MGIKFLCPNGHSLNVKTFLAGKRGVCPDCGVTFRIPSESMPTARAEAIGASADIAPETPRASEPASVQPAAIVISPGNGQAAGRPQPVVAATTPVTTAQSTLPSGIPLPASGATATPSPAAPAVVPVGVPVGVPAGSPAPYATPGGMSATPDPINDSPQAIWYIRPPSGGQYGPARGDVMRNWLVEGRVSGDSLVWREGWTDWRSAGQVFPQLAGSAPAMSAAMPVAAVTPPGANPSAASPAADATARTQRTAARYSSKKKTGSGVAIAALVGLVLVCVVLIGVLVVVLNR
jgi:hypothetical protein